MAECHPDWPATLRRASFRGVGFFVETDSIKYGRRIHTWEFPNRDRPYQEDMGEKAIEFSVTAYIASDAVLTEKAALVSACRRRGSGTLVLPTEGSQRVVVFECERTHSKDKLGYIAFTIRFGEAGLGFGGYSVALLSNLVGISVASALPSLKRDFLLNFNVVGEASWVLPAAMETVQAFLVTLDGVRLSTKLDGAKNALLAADIAKTYSNARMLAYDGVGRIAATTYSIVAIPAAAAPSGEATGALVETVGELVASLRLAAREPVDAIEALSTLAAFDVQQNVAGTGPTALTEKSNASAIAATVRRAALMELAVASAEADFADRRAAVRTRALLSEMFERELASTTGDAFQALDTVRSRAAGAISQKIADIKPVINVEANSSLPSLVWANRLYADAGRGDMLGKRNRVRHPAFMPGLFEAEAVEASDEPERLL